MIKVRQEEGPHGTAIPDVLNDGIYLLASHSVNQLSRMLQIPRDVPDMSCIRRVRGPDSFTARFGRLLSLDKGRI
jgi:hypothetical protein